MKVGDLVRLTSENELGIIMTILERPYSPDASVVDMMFPYLVHFTNSDEDWFGKNALEIVSESI